MIHHKKKPPDIMYVYDAPHIPITVSIHMDMPPTFPGRSGNYRFQDIIQYVIREEL